MNVKMKVEGMAEIMSNLKTYSTEMNDGVKKVINVGCLMISSNAKKRCQKGPKSGEIYEKYNPRRTHQASAKGEAPATDTGNLVNGIQVEIEAGGMVGYIKSNAFYSNWLEFGTTKMKARPYMYPAYAQEVPAIIKELRALGK